MGEIGKDGVDEIMLAAEDATQQLLNCIQPTLDSEEKRRDVIDYVQRLFKTRLNVEVFPYGSVPLKTYLPDGDIDFTAIKGPNSEESFAYDVFVILQEEQQNQNAEYQVKDTQFIDAEVKLVKCLVNDIVVDISFNQLGGLSTLCFLEQVDRLVGRNHLFKRSIILVKAWCYYESRILGANHGLISTYALETLILYIFHMFHSSLTGPLMVLYKFLDYYRNFDWENYCISLKGPVCKSSLPDIVGEPYSCKILLEGELCDCMCSEEFLKNCIEMFSVPSRGLGGNPNAFQIKHLNIIDPLKENNNLGRSVHKGNFYRIQSAFKYGARKLDQVILQPRDKVADEICSFFVNTLQRHGPECRISTQLLVPRFDDEESLASSMELSHEDDGLINSYVSDTDDDGEKSSAYMNGLDIYSTREFSLVDVLKQHEELDHKSQSWPLNLTADSGCSTPKADNVFEINTSLFDLKEVDMTSVGGVFHPLADLSGDYDSHIRSLLYGQLCQGCTSSTASTIQSSLSSSSSSSPSRNEKPQLHVTHHQSPPHQQSHSSHGDSVTTFVEQSVFTSSDSVLPVAACQSAGAQRTRGIGTYFPNAHNIFRERPFMRNRNRSPNNYYQCRRYGLSYGYNSASGNSSYSDNKSYYEVRIARTRSLGSKQDASLISPRSPRIVGERNQANGFVNDLNRLRFGSVGDLAEQLIAGSDHVRDSTALVDPQETQGTTGQANKGDRVLEKSIGLKNENEFPPLCQC